LYQKGFQAVKPVSDRTTGNKEPYDFLLLNPKNPARSGVFYSCLAESSAI
jgi:hypothetical protein